jgi:hypothetical protein
MPEGDGDDAALERKLFRESAPILPIGIGMPPAG